MALIKGVLEVDTADNGSVDFEVNAGAVKVIGRELKVDVDEDGTSDFWVGATKTQHRQLVEFDDAITFDNGTNKMDKLVEGSSWSPTASSLSNLSGTASFSNARYCRVGPLVQASVIVSGLSADAAGQCSLSLSLPEEANSAGDYLGASLWLPDVGTVVRSASDAGKADIAFSASSAGSGTLHLSLCYAA